MDAATWERMMSSVEQAATLAPYKILRRDGQFVVVNNAGMVKAKFKTRAEALQYQRALYVNVPGAPGKAARTKWTGKAPKERGTS